MSESKKPERSDKGSVKPNARDVFLLTWIGQQQAASLDHIQQLMERLKGRKLTEANTKWWIKRWVQANYLKRMKIVNGKPEWVWLSRKGLSEMGLDYKYLKPALGNINHMYATNAVRLHIERLLGNEAQWISHRDANRGRVKAKKGHEVDGEVYYQNEWIAIEVEITLKAKYDLLAILKELEADYETVWYFLHDHNCYESVTKQIRKRPQHEDIYACYKLSEAVGLALLPARLPMKLKKE